MHDEASVPSVLRGPSELKIEKRRRPDCRPSSATQTPKAAASSIRVRSSELPAQFHVEGVRPEHSPHARQGRRERNTRQVRTATPVRGNEHGRQQRPRHREIGRAEEHPADHTTSTNMSPASERTPERDPTRLRVASVERTAACRDRRPRRRTSSWRRATGRRSAW